MIASTEQEVFKKQKPKKLKHFRGEKHHMYVDMYVCMYVLLNSTGNQKFSEMFKIFSTHLHKLKSDHEFTCLVWVVPPSSRTIGSCWSQQKKNQYNNK